MKTQPITAPAWILKNMLKIYIIEYQSAHWAAPSDYCLVEAESEDEARVIAEPFCDEACREPYASDHDEECAASIISVEEFNEDQWQFAQMPGQDGFYPKVNF